MASTKLDDVDQAVVEAFLKQPHQLPVVTIGRRVVDEATVERCLNKKSVQQALTRSAIDRLKGVHLARSIEFLGGVVKGDVTAGVRERVSASKALLVLANQMRQDDMAGGKDIGDMGAGELHRMLEDVEKELAGRAKPVKEPKVIGQAPSVFD